MKTINGKQLKEMLITAAHNLNNNYEYIDNLNVYPVPDGDTGTNMNLTCSNGAREIKALSNDSDVFLVARTFSKGLLMGARGNSGVILSQIFRGFATGLEDKTVIDLPTLKLALWSSKERAYKAVMSPVEGTILTVIRMVAEKLSEFNDDNLISAFEYIIEVAQEAVNETPELLPQLKEAGVVDSGGTGLLVIFEGMYSELTGKSIAKTAEIGTENVHLTTTIPTGEFSHNYGYCSEFMIHIKQLSEFDPKLFKEKFARYGNSIVMVQDEHVLKLHIHTKTPGKVMNFVHKYGEFIKLKIENMSLQVEEQQQIVSNQQKVRKLVNKFAIVAVAPTDELAQVLKEEYGIQHVIIGGQSSNPSTKEFLEAIEQVDSEIVYILPNNSNIFLSAESARKVEKKSEVYIIETRTVTEGMAAALALDYDNNPKDNFKAMKLGVRNCSSASITQAIKTTQSNGVEVTEGDYVTMINKKIMASNPNLQKIIDKTLAKILKGKEILTVILGVQATEIMNAYIKKVAEDKYGVEVDFIIGNQQIYPYIFGAE